MEEGGRRVGEKGVREEVKGVGGGDAGGGGE